jgi:histidinol phosphatase-like PHP family hydrolase
VRTGIDYHIHTFYQGCGNKTLTIENIVRAAERHRMTSIAITDHLNNLGMLENFRHIRRDIESVETKLEVLFGVELNFIECDGAFAYSSEIHADYGFEVVIGGIHSDYTDSDDPVEVMDIQHRHHMRTLADPLVDVLVHPYWFGKAELDKRPQSWWTGLIADFPDDRIRELAEVSVACRAGIEVNACAMFYNGAYPPEFKQAYIDWLARLRDAGALFSIASDAHDIEWIGTTEYVEGLLDGLGVPTEQIWRPRRP